MKFFKILFIPLFLLIFAFVSGKLFFEKQTDAFLESVRSRFLAEEVTEKVLTIGLSSEFTNLDPLQNEVSIRERLVDVYEGLVKTDAFLEIQPALAVSYGALDDLTWEFRLRRNVSFHDGSSVTVDDILFSLEEAWKNSRSGFSGFLASLKSLEKIDEERFFIRTTSPDPLLLQKLSLVFIFPKQAKETILEKPVGTGPYQFSKIENGVLDLAKFQSYWGKKSDASKVTLISYVSREERKGVIQSGAVDLLANVPPEIVSEIHKGSKMEIVIAPTLESNFLLFNFQGIFQSKNLRKAVNLMLNREEIAKLAFGFAKPASQFIGKGIFGYESKLTIPATDLDAAKTLVSQMPHAKGAKVSIDLPQGFQALGELLFERLRRIGLQPEVKLHDPQTLEKIIFSGKSDLFFFGWRASLGDAAGLFESVMHSRSENYGSFNGMSYKNPVVDQLIEESEKIIEPALRLEKLREAMKILVEEDMVGIPLFTPEVLYAKKKGIGFRPRIDGYIMASEISL